ncbi:hypothetical protein HJC23_004720 [Cyclotella cryptica]|uniref:F-box domain-containing protein n=1 Tax=Cyclotella cryptica TaxID=29204 RepID=A0ABD3PSX4_9STRA|eukprot:CCRYP_012063-RA/>CCRYP_012063-RA protein AED:0.36 eAED:0.36 QI:0/-1/0/1/-1/1/1/0/819
MTTRLHLPSLCDDTLLRILSYCDLISLVRVTRGTSKQLRNRFTLQDGEQVEHDNSGHRASDVQEGYCRDIWQYAFHNHNFAPIDTTSDNSNHSCDYYAAIRHRLALFARITGKRRHATRSKKVKQCFSLPHRHFNFVPLLPPDLMNYPPQHAQNNDEVVFTYLQEQDSDDEFDIDIQHEDEQDQSHDNSDMDFEPPPVEFTCDSFALTSHSTGSEYVLLNPFSGSIEVYGSILDNAVKSEEGLLEMALLDASENILLKRGLRETEMMHGHGMMDDERSEDIAGEAIHSRIQQRTKMYDTPPRQVLFGVQDYFDLDLDEYFGKYTPFGNGRRSGNVTVDWVGVDTHLAMSEDRKCVGENLIGAARILTMESDRGDEELTCTEVYAWSSSGSGDASSAGKYASKFVCRAAGSFYFLDICARTRKIYATFQAGSGFFRENTGEATSHSVVRRHRSLMEIDDESLVDEDGAPIRMSRAIFCLPLVKYEASFAGTDAISSYFPLPEACMFAQYPVSSFSVDISGKVLIVGTVHGTVEIWHTGMHSTSCGSDPSRVQILGVREAFLRRERSMTVGARCRDRSVSGGKPDVIELHPNSVEEHETQDDLALIGDNDGDELPHKHPTSKISHIYLPRHLPAQRCGFVTKQRNSEHGTTLLLWQARNFLSGDDYSPADEHFQVVAMINLPLSARCHPEVHYDGRRLIVFGQDHIGLIFLIYHVLSTRYDQDEFCDEKLPPPKRASRDSKGREESGGVINLLNERRIKFVNRIRHAGLGGLEYYDSLMMTANERFIVVNTKSGNLIGTDGAHNASQGLLVIDLQEHEEFC